MRDVGLAAFLFVAGIFLGIRLLAGLYSGLDLWYTIRTAWPVVLRRTVGWTAGTVAVLSLLEGARRWWLVAGMSVYLLVYVGTCFMVVRIGARKPGPAPVVERAGSPRTGLRLHRAAPSLIPNYPQSPVTPPPSP